MNRYKLIACDLDGTLLGADLTLSKENYQAIKVLTERGVVVVPTTGRTLCEMEDVFGLPEIRYAIYSNGATIHDKKTGEKVVLGLGGKLLRFVFDTLLRYDTFMIVHVNGQAYADKKKAERLSDYPVSINVEDIVKNNCILIEDFEKKLPDSAVECVVVFFANAADVAACQAVLSSNPDVKAATTWPHNLEIFLKDAGKGNALKILAEKLNIPMQDVVAVGDSDNDAPMISIAGLGLATENACETLKSIADAVICNNDAHVMKYVKEHYFAK